MIQFKLGDYCPTYGIHIMMQKNNFKFVVFFLFIFCLMIGCVEGRIDGKSSLSGTSFRIKNCVNTSQSTNVWTDGTVHSPGVELRVGRVNSNNLSAGILVFELPDLGGAAITSANLRFTVSGSRTNNMDSRIDLNLDALRGSKTKGPVLASDFNSLEVAPTVSRIQESIVSLDDLLPGDFESNDVADSHLASWLVEQYEQVGAGGIIYLRISPAQDPVSNYYMQVVTASAELLIKTDANDRSASNFGDTVTLQMGSHDFSWTFNREVHWGYFIDGQPWIVKPATGNLFLTSVIPARLNKQNVYKYPSTPVKPIPVIADINITIKNPPVDHKLVRGSYQDDPNGPFGWDSRYGAGNSMQPRYNATLGWDGIEPMPLEVGDSITTAMSMTSELMPDRSSVLDALAVLTVLDSVPPDDVFRPSPLREGVDRKSPDLIRYSDVKDLTPFLIQNPVGETLGLEGGDVDRIDEKFEFPWLQQLLPGPGFINTGGSQSEGLSATYNNNSSLVSSASPSYGGYMGLFRFSPLAVGSLASWLSEDERKHCRIRLIQRAIDSYGYVKAGGCLEEGAGIMPGYSTLITIAGIMLNHAGMINVNEGINGIEPWFIFADYATSFHTDRVPVEDLAVGEAATDRQISLFYGVDDKRPELNKVDITPILSATADSMTVKDDFYWGNGRPSQDVINLKLRITAGAGAGDTIYIITESSGFKREYGGTVRVKPAWQAGIPNAASTIALSVTTSKPGSLASDDARWLWAVDGIIPYAHPAYIQKVEEISTSPTHNYITIHSGATLGNLIALYALNGQGYYKGGLDKFLIEAGTRPGYGELIFGGVYFYALNSHDPTKGKFRGALWRQEVLEHPNVKKEFVFTGQGVDSLLVPDVTAKMWYE